MSRIYRFAIFVLSMIALAGIYFLLREGMPTDPTRTTVLLSSLIMISFSSLFLEHWFTKPTDALATSLSVLLVMAPSRGQFSEMGIWYEAYFAYNSVIVITALGALLLLNEDISSDSRRNKVSRILKSFATTFGRGKFLYFGLFILTTLFYVDSQSPTFLVLIAYSAVLLAIDPKRFVATVARTRGTRRDIGEIFGVQSKSTFLAKLYKKREQVRRYDFVEFRDSSEEAGKVRKGIIVDNYVLNAEQWVKIITSSDITRSLGEEAVTTNMATNIVYRIDPVDSQDILGRFVGSVIADSNIMRIKFEYAAKVPVTEGTLLEVPVGRQRILYQIVQGLTDVEPLESKNEAGFIEGHAAQIGTWNSERLTFERFGWVPEMNSPVYLATAIDPVVPPVDELLIGHIPDTNFPVLLHKADAITHHLAVLGVTGSGKSVFARNLIRDLAGEGIKFVCVDFTEEYLNRFADLDAAPILTPERGTVIFEAISVIEGEMAKFANQRVVGVIAESEKKIRETFTVAITDFLQADRKIAIFELPDVANTTSILDFTRWFFKVLFEIAKTHRCFGQQVCVVLEEAHTVIPEWNFIGSEDKGAKALVNAIGQIALQGRKYGVGFMVIAQRTANVSKTVLTQCNTIVAFQQFDKTSADFLSNYMGKEMVEALPMLRPRYAIAVGKAFRSGLPVIFRVPDIVEPEPIANDPPAPAPEPDPPAEGAA